MRILHIDTGREMRGGQWQVLYLLRGLRDRGVGCTLLARAGSPLFRRAAEEEFDVQAVGWLSVRRVQALFDLAHAHDARAHTLAVLAGCPRLVVARRVAFPLRQGFASRWKYSRPATYVAVSAYVRGRLLEAGIDEKSIRVVYDGVPLLESAPPHDRVLAPATADPRKGAALAREASRLAAIDVTFSRDLIRDLPGARGFLYLSAEEGLGSAILLAMSAGVPVLASAVGGIPEIVRDSVTGLLTENRASEVAVRLARLVEDEKLAARLAKAARAQIAERFTTESMVEATLHVYRETLA